jgi:tRNA (mo5U34)-methyltransferase
LTGFAVAKKLLNSKVRWITSNVYKINQLNLGKFDLVLFLGVVYHLRNPYLAIDRIYDSLNIGGKVIVESHIIDGGFVDESGNWIILKDLARQIATNSYNS